LIGISLIYYFVQSVDFFVIYQVLPFYASSVFNIFGFGEVAVLDIIFFFLFVGVVGKSAQLGLHV